MHWMPCAAPQQSLDRLHLFPRPVQPGDSFPHTKPPSTSSQKPLQHWSPVRHEEPFGSHGSTTQR
jgi:hypothetical protein